MKGMKDGKEGAALNTHQRLKRPPTGLLRWAARIPILFYRLGLGGILGGRFLLLQHRGRVSGKPRYVVLEVVEEDLPAGRFVVASGWGRKSDWFRNILKTSAVEVTHRRNWYAARAEVLSPEEGFDIISRYAGRYPGAFRELGRMMIHDLPREQEAACRAISETIPFVALILES